MTEEELEWYEKNWHKGKSLKDRTDNSREYKSVCTPWWVDWDRHTGHYSNDCHCWKSKRKTHYKTPKKSKKEKKRKERSKEQWRFKESYSYRARLDCSLKCWEAKRESRKREQARQRAHIDELKKTGQWIYRWKYNEYFIADTRTWHYMKIDLNDPFCREKYQTR